MNQRTVAVRPGRHSGWWVEGRLASGRLSMINWVPSKGLADWVARLVGPG